MKYSNSYECFLRNSFVSIRLGAEGCAPSRVTDIAEAAEANLTASKIDFPSKSDTARFPQ